MKVHKLKILPEYYNAQVKGIKNFEIRKNDRNYQIGDWLLLKEYNPKIKKFTERKVMVEITYITDYQQKHGYKEFETMITDILEKHYDHD